MSTWTRSHSVRIPLILLAVVEALVVFSAVVVAGSQALNTAEAVIVDATVAGTGLTVVLRAFVVVIALLASLLSMGLYHFQQRLSFSEISLRVAMALVIASIVVTLVYLAFPQIALPAKSILLAALVTFSVILAVRFYYLRNVDNNGFRRRTLVYGDGHGEASIAQLRRRADRRGFVLVGTVDPGECTETNGTEVGDGAPTLVELARELDVDEIVIAMRDRRGKLPTGQLLECIFNDIDVIELHEFMERESGKVPADLINPSALFLSPGFRVSGFKRQVKRTFDVLACLIVLALVWPIMLLVALGILLEDGPRASIIYRQDRVGYKGKVFKMMKFRSMVENAEDETGAVWASRDDKRITRVGRLIRKARIDELPQLFNVLGGQMSIVGPRPERPQFVEELAESIPYYGERHTAKPGITGWAQLRYPYGSSQEDALQKLQFDLFYIKNQSFTLDLAIILQTMEVVLFGKGAR